MKKVIFLFEEKDRQRNEYSAAVIWWYGILENLGYEVEYYDYFNFDFNKFLLHVKEEKPAFVIHGAYDKVHTEFLKLKEYTKLYIMHSDDDWRFNDFAKYWIPIVDGTISFCGSDSEMKELYSAQGCDERSFIKGYWAFNPNTMLCDRTHERKHISHVGSIYGERQQKIDKLNNNGLRVDVFTGVYYETFKDILLESKYSLCFTKSSNLQLNQLKGRLFEIPYFCPVVTEHFPDMEKYYDVNEDIIVFNSSEELIEKISLYNSDLDRYNRLYENGKKRLLSNHTCYHMWNERILPFIDEDYKKVNVPDILKNQHGIAI
jgi:hypothetical protein